MLYPIGLFWPGMHMLGESRHHVKNASSACQHAIKQVSQDRGPAFSKMNRLPLSPRDTCSSTAQVTGNAMMHNTTHAACAKQVYTRSVSSKYVVSSLPRALGGASIGSSPRILNRLNCTATLDEVSGVSSACTCSSMHVVCGD